MAYLVRSFRTYARIRSLTTGTFNRIFKDRTTLRLSGAYSVQPDPHKCESDRPRNLLTIPFAQLTVNATPAQHFHLFSTRGSSTRGQPPSAVQSSKARLAGKLRTQPWKSGPSGPRPDSTENKGFSPCGRAQRYSLPPQKSAFQRARRSGRQKIEKRTKLWRSLP